MATISTAKASDKLMQQLHADQQAVKHQTQMLLQEHARSLKGLSQDALLTTKVAIQRHSQELSQLHSQTLANVRWMLLWPLLASLAVSLMVVVMSVMWSGWTVNQASSLVQTKRDQALELEREFCASPAGKERCVPKG